MRLLTLAVIALVLIGSAMAYFTYFGLREADVGALVPHDFRFGVFYSSGNDLIEIYEGEHERRDFHPALARIGVRINVPDLNGFDYDAPVCSYVNQAREEVFVIPFEDFGAFSDAFDTSRENLNLRDPERVASNYLSVSVAKAKAKRGRDNELAAAAARYPIALAGHPDSPNSLRLMLRYLLRFDKVSRIPDIPMLSTQVGRLPNGVASVVAEECDDLLIGFRRPRDPALSGDIEIVATPRAGGVLSRARTVATELQLDDVLKAFPRDTVILAGAVLDGAGWKRIGVPFDLGDAAFAFGIVAKQYRSRRYTLLVVAKPRDVARTTGFDARVLLDDPSATVEWSTIQDGDSDVRTSKLGAPPEWLATMLRAKSAKNPTDVYLSTASEKGVWMAAVGSQAEDTVRIALACLRGSRQLSLFAQQRGLGGEAQPSPIKEDAGRMAVCIATAKGMRALAFPMPIVDIAGIGQPRIAVLELSIPDKARATLRLTR